jgi:hypothetical protein
MMHMVEIEASRRAIQYSKLQSPKTQRSDQ